MKDTIIVTGGAGYIGSHMVKYLLDIGKKVIVLDNFSTSSPDNLNALSDNKNLEVIEVDLCDYSEIEYKLYYINPEEVEGVIHFAGYSLVEDSMNHPSKYYNNNVLSTVNTLEYMKNHGIDKIVYSSSAAIYGDANDPGKKLEEDDELYPSSVYGYTKLLVELIVDEYYKFYDIEYIGYRYFNAAGASLDSTIGENHKPETHLIPLVVDSAIYDNSQIHIFGTDYPTEDGTCVRDYVHVMDLAEAHYRALEYLEELHEPRIFNLGSSKGYSVKEVIDKCSSILEKELYVVDDQRREGDPSYLVADTSCIKAAMDWEPQYDLTTIIESAINWHKKKGSLNE